MKITRSSLVSMSVLILMAVASAPFNRAQTLAAVRVQSNPDGPWFEVDGTTFYHVMSAFWPAGSSHTLYATAGQGYAYNLDQTIQWKFQNWQWSGGTFAANPLQITADPNITQYTAIYSTQYLFTLQVSCNPAPCAGTPGVVNVGQLPVSSTQSIWQSPGNAVVLQAFAGPGYTFAGWQAGPNQSIVGFQDTVTMSSPVTVNAVFLPATPVTIVSVPPNLQVYADRTLTDTPVSLPWGQGTTHSIGAVDVQIDDHGKRWIFSSWSDGGAPTHNYVVANNTRPETITATHIPAAYPVFLTVPNALALVVDNQVLPPPYSYLWGVGTVHTITAPASQKDAQGNSWTFKSWDDLVTTPTRTITIPVGADIDGYRLTALYDSQATLNIGSTVSGLTVTVDGTACTTPCSVSRSIGSQVHVNAPASIPVGTGSRQDFLGWSTGGSATVAGDWVSTLNASSTSISATYHQMNLLSASANPSGGAAWKIQPSSTDGFYDSQTTVNLGVTAQPGFRFSSWGGDLSGSAPSATLSMNAPHAVVAQFNLAPYIAPSGVMNAAALAPQPGVAAGSVASIFGASLASTTAIGPASPMVQSLAGVTAHIGSRTLPLYFASPAQINLQIPSDLLGAQTITVSSQGLPDVSATFNVARNAPGLFSMLLDGQSYALVLHQDGSLVLPSAPAQKGELLTMYVTGLGPTLPARPDGTAVPQTPPYLATDPVTLQVGNAVYTPQNAYAAPGQVGLDLVQFHLDSSVASGSAVSIYLTVNGVNSNTVNLPIQ